MTIIHELQDYTYLNWTKSRHSSGTAGSFLKAYEKKNGKKLYYKLSNYDVVKGIVGHECVNEIIVDRLLTLLEIPHLSYELIHAKVLIRGVEYETYLCCSEDFKTKGDMKIALDAFYDKEALAGETPLVFCKRMGFETQIYEMFLIDYLILNRDRHGANLEVLKNSQKKTIELAPLFDHGLSLLFHIYDTNSIETVDYLEDKKVQSFVGGASTYDNLSLIPIEFWKELPPFDDKMFHFLFDGVEELMGELWISHIWKFLKTRGETYEDLRTSKCRL